MNETGRPLTSPVYLGALAVLMVNDWLLKPSLHNELTGKLSDLAGVFAITWFGLILLPRYRWLLSLSIAAAFVYWKSPHSAALIAAWNGLNLFSVGRVVDYSDCVALATIPMAQFHASRARASVRRPIGGLAVAAISVLAFTGTTFQSEYEYNRSYSFPMSTAQLRDRLIALTLSHREVSPLGILAPEELEVRVPANVCTGTISATVRVEESPSGARLRLIKMDGCPGRRGEKQAFLEVFEAKIVERIRPDP
jgi:hypothetical protein